MRADRCAREGAIIGHVFKAGGKERTAPVEHRCIAVPSPLDAHAGTLEKGTTKGMRRRECAPGIDVHADAHQYAPAHARACTHRLYKTAAWWVGGLLAGAGSYGMGGDEKYWVAFTRMLHVSPGLLGSGGTMACSRGAGSGDAGAVHSTCSSPAYDK